MRFNQRLAWLLGVVTLFAGASPLLAAEPAKKDAARKHATRKAAPCDLSQPVEIEFIDAPLSDVCEFLATAAAVQIVIDPIGVTEEQKATPITIKVHDIPLELGLDLILEPMGLSYFTREGIVVVTTNQRAAETMETKVFDVVGLVSDDVEDQESSMDALIDTISRSVEPSSWPDVGGRGVMVPYRCGRTSAIVVFNSQRAHRKIASLLDDLRSVVSKHAEPPGKSRQGAATKPVPALDGLRGLVLNRLPKTDEVLIACQTNGCFHSARYELFFSGHAPGKVKVTGISGPADKPERRYLATVSFSPADQKQLDQQVAFYRTKPPGGCTTVEQMKISVARDGRIVGTETFVDGSCSRSRNVLSAVARRAELRTPIAP